ncbi:hypothetical protein Dsin_019070 [Dipteronia sinensis]|uniref:PRLI-interacting factor A n=1 Tax=Dipteronia sinensis TaxID=43782 RepID=A0AAE0A7C7_9ROSI|nr:hypothetical protein Dsin_019070 [Dipteronia sinensis]
MNDQQTQMMINQAQHIMNQAPPPPQVTYRFSNYQYNSSSYCYYNRNVNEKNQQSIESGSRRFQVINQQPPPLPQLPVQSQPMMMLNRSYNKNINNNNNNSSINNNNKPWPGKIGNFGSSKPRTNNNNNNNNNWKGKKITIDKRRIDNQIANAVYNPPTLHELQSQNRQKTRKFYSNKKKFNNNNNNNRFAPYAPRNTTSFIIRAKKAGGIASLVSPCPVTPAVLPTPIFSPSREVLGDMAKEEWGVDGYGSMKGLIRLRSGNDHDEEDDDEGNGSSESDVEEHVEVERRLDHDLSRFEMIYPNHSNNIGGVDYNNVLENRVDDQDSHISQLEEENLTLKERLFLMERELSDLRRRMQFLERQSSNQHQSCVGVEDVHEEVVENGSENESENGSDVREHREENNEDVCMQVSSVPVKKEEEIARNEFGDDSMLAESDDRRNIEEVDNQMVAEVKSEDEQKEAGNEIVENKVNLVAEKEESKDEQMCEEKSIDGMD